jgi:predicted metal-binding membrane protein
MGAVAIRPVDGLSSPASTSDRRTAFVLLPVIAIVGVAWATLLLLDLTGIASTLHHHALIEGGPPLWIAIPLFLVAWQLMVAAMMVPASLPAIRAAAAIAARIGSLRVELAFVVGFLAIWAVFGLVAFLGDMVVHRVVDATPWLAARPWLIEAGVLALAGGYQFVPRKRRDLETCRHPSAHASGAGPTLRGAAGFGLAHGIACVGASGALMLLMFGQGFSGLGWMLALAVVMALETTLRSPQRLTTVVGIGLILASVATLAGATGF